MEKQNKTRYRLNLRLQIYLILCGLVLVVLLGGLVTIWHTFHIERLMTSVIEKYMAAFEMAEEMDTKRLSGVRKLSEAVFRPHDTKRLSGVRKLSEAVFRQSQSLEQEKIRISFRV